MDVISAAALASAFAKVMGLANQGNAADVQRDLIELQPTVMEVVAENEGVIRENGELKRKLETRESARNVNGVVYFGTDPMPFCGACFGTDGSQIPLLDKQHNHDLICPRCKATPPRPGRATRADEGGGVDPIQPGDEILKGGGR